MLLLTPARSASADDRAAALRSRLEAARASLVTVELTSRVTLERFPGVGEGGRRVVRTETTGVVATADGLVVLAAARVDPSAAAFALLGSKAKPEVERVLVIGSDGKAREAAWVGRDEERGLAYVRVAASGRAGLAPLAIPDAVPVPAVGDELAVVSLAGKTLGRVPRVDVTRVAFSTEKPRRLLGLTPQVSQALGGIVYSLDGGAVPAGILVGLPAGQEDAKEATPRDILAPDALATAGAGYVLTAADLKAGIAKPPSETKATAASRRVRSWIGIKPETLTPEIAKARGLALDDGVRVVKVWKGTPAEKAGLAANDVITRLDGELVSLDPGESWRSVEDLGVGQKVKLTVFHEGKGKELDVVLAEAPLAPEDAQRTKLAALSGVVRELTFFDKDDLGLPEAAAGAVVADLDPDGAAARAGLRAGDAIVQVDGKDFAGADGLREALGDSGERALSVRRGSETLSLKLRR
ncbi:PDZ domain-containing protein [bacterium]|nr:PDZ domain-containing protein [bacterium]